MSTSTLRALLLILLGLGSCAERRCPSQPLSRSATHEDQRFGPVPSSPGFHGGRRTGPDLPESQSEPLTLTHHSPALPEDTAITAAEGLWDSWEWCNSALRALGDAGVTAFGSTGIGWEIIVHKSELGRARVILKSLPGSDRIYIPE